MSGGPLGWREGKCRDLHPVESPSPIGCQQIRVTRAARWRESSSGLWMLTLSPELSGIRAVLPRGAGAAAQGLLAAPRRRHRAARCCLGLGAFSFRATADAWVCIQGSGGAPSVQKPRLCLHLALFPHFSLIFLCGCLQRLLGSGHRPVFN